MCDERDNVSNKFINNCYTEAKKRGSLGGKILGAGNGGFLLLLAKKTNHKKIQNSLKKFGLEKYNFKLENSGSKIINNFWKYKILWKWINDKKV